MYAVVEIKGMQFKVRPEQQIRVPKTEAESGSKLSYDRVLFLNDGKKPVVGTPTVNGASVEATVVEHGKDKKVLVFKKKRRKRYQRTRGHRQQYTTIQIDKIVTASKKKAAAKKTAPKKPESAEAEETSKE